MIVASILALVALVRVEHFAETIVATTTNAVLSKIDLPSKDVLANIRELTGEVRALGNTLREIMKTTLALIAVAALALTVTTSAQAASPAPLYQTDAMTTITQVAVGCGVDRTRVGGVCVSRIAKRQVRRQARRTARWD